jgi:nitrous oxide reductase accessory protein NosL
MVPFRKGPASSLWAITFLFPILVVLSSCDKPETPPRAVPEDQDLSHREAKDVSPGRTGPRPAPAGIDVSGRLHPGEGDRCPVCAMGVQGHPKFVCGIQLHRGETFYFCAPGCMIRSWLHPEVFLGVERTELKKAVVQDYFSGEHADASSVIWVAGSDVMGPMGPALVALLHEQDLEAFRSRHGGRTTFRLADLDDSRWEAVTGKTVLPATP